MNITLTLLSEGVIYSLPATLIKSKRRSVGITIKLGGTIIIRAPKYMPTGSVMNYVQEKSDWILKTYERQSKIIVPEPDTKSRQTLALEKRYRDAAKDYIPKRVAYYHQFTGGDYQKITIRDPKTRWGSCSSNGTLSFSFRLMMAPPRVLDYVIVHELCHLTHMNHSKEFWNMVEHILPDYKEYRKWLKENGHLLF